MKLLRSHRRLPHMIETSTTELQRWCASQRAQGKTIGFVPTMGALHEGHLSLVGALRSVTDTVVVSIFVNPTQFGPTEDFAKYPRTLEADAALLGELGVEYIFAPSPESMVRMQERTTVHVRELTEHLCGPLRPGHFEGVATVVAKLFGLVGPCTAAFGRKDYQQYKVIERMVSDLFFPVKVVGVPTMREADGLAMSSRNRYLSPADRQRALIVPAALKAAVTAHAQGVRSAGVLRTVMEDVLRSADRIEYAEVSDADTLAPFAGDAEVPDRALFATAVRVGATRLIDNMVTGETLAREGGM